MQFEVTRRVSHAPRQWLASPIDRLHALIFTKNLILLSRLKFLFTSYAAPILFCEMVRSYRKSHTEIGKIYFYTASIRKWFPIFINDYAKEIIVSTLKYLSNKKKLLYLHLS